MIYKYCNNFIILENKKEFQITLVDLIIPSH